MKITHDKRLKCSFCNSEELELKPNQDLAIVKESYKPDTVTQYTDTSIKEICKPDDAHTLYIDFCSKGGGKGYHQLYITTYCGSTYVGWNKYGNSLETFYAREDNTKD